jgi:hypothetical protein
MSDKSFNLKYHDGTEIALGDSIRYNNVYGEVVRIIYPSTKNSIDYNVINGGVLVRMQGGMLFAFDHDYCELHCHVSFVFVHRAKLSFHIKYSIRKFIVFIRNLWYLIRKCFCGSFNEGLFFLKEWWLSVIELVCAIRHGSGSNVTQIGAGEQRVWLSKTFEQR